MVDFILSREQGKRLVILSTVSLQAGKDIDYQLDIYAGQGMTRAKVGNEIVSLEELKGGGRQDGEASSESGGGQDRGAG